MNLPSCTGRLAALLIALPTVAAAHRVEPTTPAPSPDIAPADSYHRRLEELDRRVQELRSKLFTHSSRIRTMGREVLGMNPGGSRASIVHRNGMGASFTPVKLVFLLDGSEVLARSDEHGLLAPGEELTVFDGPLTPENHTLSVTVEYRGANALFRYIEGFRFHLRESHTFPVAENRSTQVTVVGYEKGNVITTEMAERPALDFRITLPDPMRSRP